MCKTCVADGLMTQDQLDSILAGAGDAPSFIRELLAGGQEPMDAETGAQVTMDGQVASILKFYAERASKLDLVDIELDSAEKVSVFTEGAAMELMFRQAPQAIAWTLALVLHRYVDLLDKWATLYVAANSGDDGESVDLDAITNEAARSAVQAKTLDPAADLRTGFYL